jgi:UDP-N-acetylglucosamine acyltransferase
LKEDVSIGYYSIVEEGVSIGQGAIIGSHCVIEAGAVIGAGCRIGRYSVIGSRVVLGQDTTVDSHCNIGGGGSIRIGAQNKIGSYCRITAWESKETVIGDRNQFFSQVVVGFAPMDYTKQPPPAGGILIGDDNVFREGVSIDAACGHGPDSDITHPPLTHIGNNCYLMRNSHVAHDGILEDYVVLTMNVQLAGYTTVMQRSNIGVGSVVHQFSTIGPYCMVGMGSVVTRDPLPFTMYLSRAGSDSQDGSVAINRIGLERSANKTDIEIDQLETYYQEDYSPLRGALGPQASSERWFHRHLLNFDRYRANQERKRSVGNWLKDTTANQSACEDIDR